MSVRDGQAKEPQITRLATIRAQTDEGKNHGFKQTSASRLTDVYALAERAMGRHSRTPWFRCKDVPPYSYADPGGVCSLLYIHFCGVGWTLRNTQYNTLAPLASGPASPGSPDLDLATGFEKAATLAAGTASRCEGAISPFGFQEKRGLFCSSLLYFPLSVLTIPFGGW